MKKITFLTIFFLSAMLLNGQTDFSGLYSYKSSSEKMVAGKESSTIPGGRLVLLKMEGNQYRFWLDVMNGPPGYNRGETDGTIIFRNDTASFDNTFEDAELPCILSFKINGKVISINSHSTSFNCGFGNGVTADGDFTKDKVQPTFNNAWLKKQYYMTPSAVVSVESAQLYADATCQNAKPQSFNKGDVLLSIADNTSTFYTEYITEQGKFIYGWLFKSAVKLKSVK